MATLPHDDPPEVKDLVRRAAEGDEKGWQALWDRDRERLRRMVALRMDRRLQGRIDPSDVLQEAFLEASQRLAEYVRQPTMPFFLWLRFLTVQRLLALHRHHVGAKMRAAGREVSLDQPHAPEATSAALAAQLMGQSTRPSEAAMREELKRRLLEALDHMEPLDREVLALRHFEQLSGPETAQVLGIGEEAAKKSGVGRLLRPHLARCCAPAYCVCGSYVKHIRAWAEARGGSRHDRALSF